MTACTCLAHRTATTWANRGFSGMDLEVRNHSQIVIRDHMVLDYVAVYEPCLDPPGPFLVRDRGPFLVAR